MIPDDLTSQIKQHRGTIPVEFRHWLTTMDHGFNFWEVKISIKDLHNYWGREELRMRWFSSLSLHEQFHILQRLGNVQYQKS